MSLEDRIRDGLAGRLSNGVASDDAWEQIETRLQRRGRVGVVLTAMVALTAAAAAIGFVAWNLRGDLDATPGGATWRGLWPQKSREQAERAQVAAERGSSRYLWQVSADGEELVLRYVLEELAWSKARPLEINVPPDGVRAVRRWQVVRCAPGIRNAQYPEVDCAPPQGVTYPAVYITVERLIRRDLKGIWIVTGVERTEVRQFAPAPKEQVRRFVAAFLGRRVQGSGAEKYLSLKGRREFRSGSGGLAPLYRSMEGFRYEGYEITFVDGPVWPYGNFEVGARLLRRSGPPLQEETLFVGPGTDLSGERKPLVIVGGRAGLSGP